MPNRVNRLGTGAMECSYNGYFFGDSADTVGFSVTPNLDAARRTVVSATYRIKVAEYIADTVPTDPIVIDAIARLSRNGGKLRYEGRGFGGLRINTGGGGGPGLLAAKDVRWGPITENVSAVCTGGGTATLLTWEVVLTTVNCPDGLTEAGTILSFNFSVTYDIDKEGYTTRDYDATLTIAQTRKKVDDKTLAATADMHREKMVPALLAGFRRESQSYPLSLDKCTLSARARDVQLPPELPPVGVVAGSVKHGWASQGLARWVCTVGARYDIARREGTPLTAITHFFGVVEDVVAEARKMTLGAGLDLAGGFKLPKIGGAEPVAGKPVTVIPLSATATQPDKLGRTQVEIGVTFMVAGVGFSEILRSGGLWQSTSFPNTEANWKVWVASIPTVFSPRGHAMLKFDPKEDSLVDACIPGQGLVPFDPSKYRPNEPATSPPPDPGHPVAAAFLKAFPPPRPESSWVEYRTAVTIHPEMGRVVGDTLPVLPLSGARGNVAVGWSVAGGPPATAPAGVFPFPPAAELLHGQLRAGGEPFVHQRTRPTLYVTVRGTALRAGWNIPVPELVEVSGVRPVLVGSPRFTTGIVGNTLVPIVRADFEMTYMFPGLGGNPIGSIGAPANSFLT